MAIFLLSECLEIILSNLIEYPSSNIETNIYTRDLYSCTLVSRHWCRISTTLLYAYPFHHFHINYSHKLYYKLIRTLLSCIPQFEKQALQIPYDTNSNTLSTFNYTSFICGLIFSKMMFGSQKICDYYKEIWLSANMEGISTISTIIIMNHLIKFICKHCKNLTTLEFSVGIKNNDDIIKLLTFKDCNEKSKLCDLKELYYSQYNNNLENNFYFSPNNICNLNLLYIYINEVNTVEKANSLSQFISLQKKLKHLILSGFEKD